MRRWLVPGLCALAFVACQQGHPVSIYIDKALNEFDADKPLIEKIAVMPFVSALNDADDPDGDAPRTFEKFFTPALDDRADYTFISSGTVQFAVDREGWQKQYENFLEDYAKSGKKDLDFLSRLAEILKCDAFLIPVVDTWYKDEVDFRESASATTTVGATITILDARIEPGRVLFRAIDEDTEESARAEMEDRGLVTSAGIVRSDRGARAYQAPPYEDVAVRVVEALVGSLPPH